MTGIDGCMNGQLLEWLVVTGMQCQSSYGFKRHVIEIATSWHVPLLFHVSPCVPPIHSCFVSDCLMGRHDLLVVVDRCVGSSSFLKSRFGTGYHMTMVKEPSCNSALVEQLVRSVVKDAQVSSSIC